MKSLLVASALALMFAGPVFAASSESDTSSATSTTSAAEQGISGDHGFGNTSGGATVTATNTATDKSASTLFGGVVTTSSNGSDVSSVTGMQFSHGTFGFDGSTDMQTGSSSGSATGSSSAHTFHHH